MGTKADFYLETEAGLEWIASYCYNGFPHGIAERIGLYKAKTANEFRNILYEGLNSDSATTFPEMGWPWPWDNSRLTDYAYLFRPSTGMVYVSDPPRCWLTIHEYTLTLAEKGYEGFYDWWERLGTVRGLPQFPDMSGIKNVTRGPRSGLIVFL